MKSIASSTASHLIVIFLPTLGSTLMAQTQAKLLISGVQAPSVRVVGLAETPAGVLPALRQNHALGASVVVVANDSSHPIVAISARWVISDTAGKQKSLRQKCDIFLPAGIGKVVLPPGRTLFFGPNSVAYEGVGDPASSIFTMERRTFDGLSAVSKVDVVIDGIMFENGEMYAPDTSYGDEIRARIKAAKDVVDFVRGAASRGRSMPDIRKDLSTIGQGKTGDHGSWLSDFSSALARMPDDRFDIYLRRLGQLREPVITLRPQKH